MKTLSDILRAAERLSERDRRRLIEALQDSIRESKEEERTRREAMSAWLGLAGRFHSDFTDVSSDKYKHLADVYADKR